MQDRVRGVANQSATTSKASYNGDDLNGPKMPTDHIDPAVSAIQLENSELRREVQELRIQMNFVLSFLDIKNVAAGDNEQPYRSSTKKFE